MNNKIIVLGLVIIAIVVLGWSAYTTISSNNTAKYEYYETLIQGSGTECGDLNDNSNVQHLSHHPQQYTECIKKVDPAKFKEAVGQEKQDFLKSVGIG